MEDKITEIKTDLEFKIGTYIYYVLIGVLSLISCAFLPMIGSDAELGWNFPTTTSGWIVWSVTKVLVATVNMLLFFCFMSQGKINVKDDEFYKKANEILRKHRKKEAIPRSPSKWQSQQYSRKGVLIFLTSALAVIALTPAILKFDWIACLTYLFTIIMGIIFGIIQMKSAEAYWTDEYYMYALMIEEQETKKEDSEESVNEEVTEDAHD